MDDQYILGILYPHAIGHLASESAAYLLEVALKRRRSVNLTIYSGEFGFANPHFAFKYLSTMATLSNSKQPISKLYKEANERGLLIDCYNYSSDNGVSQVSEIFSAAKDLPPPFRLTDEDREYCREILKVHFGHADYPHVTVSVRKSQNRPQDISHQHRNSDFSNVIPALELCYKKLNGKVFVVLTGDDIYPKDLPQWIWNYPASKIHSDRADISLLGSTALHFGTNSGINSLPSVFGRPCALHNIFPYGIGALGKNDLIIYKTVYDRVKRRRLSVAEAVEKGFLQGRDVLNFRSERYIIIDNSPREISELMDVAIDLMMQRIDSTFFSLHDQQFRKALPEFRNCWGMACHVLPSWLDENLK